MKPFGAHYGAMIGLHAVGGTEAVRVLILPNLQTYSKLLQDALTDDNPRRPEAERVLNALLALLGSLRENCLPLANGHPPVFTDDLRDKLGSKVGELLAGRIANSGDVQLAHAILNA